MTSTRFLVCFFLAASLRLLAADNAPVAWGDATWKLQVDPASGALVHLENATDSQHMDWLREAGQWQVKEWKPDPGAVTQDGQWGLVETAKTGLLHAAKVRKISGKAWEAVYTSASLTVTVRREIDANGELAESYAFQDTGLVALDFPLGSIAITAPLFDQYPDAQRSLNARCNVHLWMGGSSAWINALRMDAAPPNLGLVLTQGSLDAYSQRGGTLNDRGVLLLHPAAMKLVPGKSETIAWKLFWHKDWKDFFARLGTEKKFVRLTAKNYTVETGLSLEITADSASPLDSAKLTANGQPVDVHVQGGHLTASIPTTQPGEILVELSTGSGKTWLRANVVPHEDDLIAARLKFIVRHQQRNAPGDPLHGAYLSYDNSTGQQVYSDKPSDHNAGRERTGMGVLAALYLPLCRDAAFKAELKTSLDRYNAFFTRELEDDSGVVYGSIGRTNDTRLYNYPWAAQFHLAMYRATGDQSQLDRMVRVIRTYYARGGSKFYAIGLPVTDGLKALQDTEDSKGYGELLLDFRRHADQFVANGLNYPASEVAYEQSIVAPSVQFLAEVYLATGDKKYLAEAKQQMVLLEAFCGQQPDFRLYEVPIRHWDDYWFGKLHVYGDTLPHYWGTLDALAYADCALAEGNANGLDRAGAVLTANESLFRPDGSATCAHVYPLTSNGQPGAQDDPWANDQDWALVHLLMYREILKSAVR